MNVRSVRNDGPTLTPLSSRFPRWLRPPRFPHLTIFLALLIGCHSSPEQKQEKLRQEQKSWEATAQLTDELSQSGAVPAVYRRQVMEKASKNLDRIRQQEQQLSR